MTESRTPDSRPTDGSAAPSTDPVALARDLIRIDSSNPTSDERAAAEYVAALLSDLGLPPRITESAPGRTSLVSRWEGTDPSAPALLVHHHLDVVPADPADWTVHPFSGEIRDGCLWGRGAVDMKGSVATTLAAVAGLHAEGHRPQGDVVLAFSADEEAGGHMGVKHLVQAEREMFDGVTEAIGEVGGFSIPVPGDRRLYPVQVAEKGQAWMRLTAHGTSSHGSMDATNSALLRIARTVDRIGSQRFPVHLVKSCRAFLDRFAAAHGLDLDEEQPEAVLEHLGSFARMIGPTTRHTANPTMFESGYKVNVVPEKAIAHVDGRFLPGGSDDFTERILAMLEDGVEHEWIHHDIAVETDLEGPLVSVMESALTAEDPAAELVPFCMPGGTDAKTYSTLGIRCFGFMPLRLPPELDFAAMFHGIDERVPTESLEFGTRVVRRLLSSS